MKKRRWHGKVLRCKCSGHEYIEDKLTHKEVYFPMDGKYDNRCPNCNLFCWYVGPPPKGVKFPGFNFGLDGGFAGIYSIKEALREATE